jgi:hypothetical protein
MALIIKSPTGASIGKMVEVIDFYGEAKGDNFNSPQPNCWLVVFEGSKEDEFGRRYAQPDAWMLPIRPGDLQETDEDVREIPIKVPSVRAARIRELLDSIAQEAERELTA